MITLALILAQAAAPQTGPADPADVVVIGRRPADTGAALAACIARDCPPKEEIAASLAHAEAQMITGDYQGSRRTLLSARGRNGRYAASLPVDVSDLHRANARLADLNGLRESGRIGVFDIVDALKAGLSRDDERVMVARLEVGDAFAKAGRYKAATLHYRAIAGRARDAGMLLVEGMALFRRAALLAALASVEPDYRYSAKQAAADVTRSGDPAWAPFREALRLVPALLTARTDKGVALDAVIKDMAPRPPDKPELLYAPVLEPNDIGFGAARGDEEVEWVDMSFRISRVGTVEEVRQARASDGLPASWVEAITKSLRARRYAPVQLAPGEPGPRRIERYAFVSDLAKGTGSGMRVRSAARRIDVMDLTPAPSPPRD